jgi:hypothetical protein
VGLVAFRHRWPGALAAWASYLVMLTPSSGLIPTGGQYIASDRYCFLPTMAFVVLAASALCSVVRGGRWPRSVVGGIFATGVVVCLALVVRTRDQCRTWRDSVALWSHALATSTEPNPFVYHSLGLARAGEPGKLAEAESLIAKAVRMVPSDPSVRNALTIVLAKQGRIDEALFHTREVLRLAPNNIHAWVNLGILRAIKGDPTGAAAAFEWALQIDPNNADAHRNLGLLLLSQGKSAEAHLLATRRLNPSMIKARRALEDLRRRQNRYSESPDPPREGGR